MNTNAQDIVNKYQILKLVTLQNVVSLNFKEIKIKISEKKV